MYNIYESLYYDVSYRTVLNSENVARVFTEKDAIEVDSDVNFDVEGSYKSALNYFASSVIGGVVQNLLFRLKKKHIEVSELEGRIELKLQHPLTILDVKGYEEEPRIKECEITIYLYADVDEEELVQLCHHSLNSCFIYNTLKDTVEMRIRFVPLL